MLGVCQNVWLPYEVIAPPPTPPPPPPQLLPVPSPFSPPRSFVPKALTRNWSSRRMYDHLTKTDAVVRERGRHLKTVYRLLPPANSNSLVPLSDWCTLTLQALTPLLQRVVKRKSKRVDVAPYRCQEVKHCAPRSSSLVSVFLFCVFLLFAIDSTVCLLPISVLVFISLSLWT